MQVSKTDNRILNIKIPAGFKYSTQDQGMFAEQAQENHRKF